MDDNIENEETTQRSQPRRGSSALNDFAGGFKAGLGINDKKDVDAINRRGKNTPSDMGGNQKKNEEEGGNKNGKENDLPEKEGLKDNSSKGKDGKNGKNLAEVKKKEREEAIKKAKEAAKKKATEKVLKSKAAITLKLKIYLYVGAAVLALLSLIFLIAFFAFTFNNLTSSISSFFGVSEKGLDDDSEDIEKAEKDGLYTDKK